MRPNAVERMDAEWERYVEDTTRQLQEEADEILATTWEDAPRILSFGGGVNTVALLLLLEQREVVYEGVVFADTEGEWPETYAYLKTYVLPFCQENDISFNIVHADKEKLGVTSLEEWCLKNESTPSRMHRWCTDRWKIRAIREFVRERFGRAICLMGIDYDEVHRMHQPHYAQIRSEYPLVEWKMTRLYCQNVIESHGWPVPSKSGCFFCPFQRNDVWRELFLTHPELYERAEFVERSNRGYPEWVLSNAKRGGKGVPLSELKVRFGHGFTQLEEFMQEEPCDNGWCELTTVQGEEILA